MILSSLVVPQVESSRTTASTEQLRESRTERDESQPRLIVLTDISSLTAGVAEPDDGQSLIRLMLYANEFDIEGLIATSNLGHGQTTRPDLIRQVVDAYEKVRPNLLQHDPRYPPAEALRGCIKAGQEVAGLKVPVEASVGQGKDTEASEWIMRVVDRPDPRPVWVVIWGGSADLAQALWRVRRDRTPEELSRFVARLRVHAIGDQDSTGPWIREQFPGLFMITQRRAYRGMYRGGDASLVSSSGSRRTSTGTERSATFTPTIGAVTSGRGRSVRCGGSRRGTRRRSSRWSPMGCLTPPTPGSELGRSLRGEGNQLTDIPDDDIDTGRDPDPRMSSVYRWRPAFQADFAARLDWCVKPFKEANHPPVVRISGESTLPVKPGEVVTLDASGTTDPDGDDLTFEWSIYPHDPDIANIVTIHGGKTAMSRFEVGPILAGKTIPILLTVRDSGKPSLTRYGRVLLRVEGPK